MNNNLTNNKNLSKLIQSGAIGLAILLIVLVAYMFNKYDKMANNHAIELTDALRESTRTDQELLGAVNGLSDKIDDLDGSMQKFMEYMAEFTAPFPNYP